jgi:thiamine-monophosphate kinase
MGPPRLPEFVRRKSVYLGGGQPLAGAAARLTRLGLSSGAAGGGGEIAGEDGSVADLGEWGVIAALQTRMPAGPLTSVGIGDDAAVVRAPSGSVVAAVDLVIEGRHFRQEWSSAYDVGVKAAARSLADIAAMGAVNTALLVALATPGALPARWATDLASGLAAEATRAGAGIVGGDTARAEVITLSVTALGDLEGRPPVLRSGARPGDVIAVAGPLGRSAAGLALLTAGHRGGLAAAAALTATAPATPGSTAGVEGARSAAAVPGESISAGPATADAKAGSATAKPATGSDEPVSVASAGLGAGALGESVSAALAALVAAHLRPAPPYDAGPEAALLGATAMIDVSDGLLADLGHVAAASGVNIDVSRALLAPGSALLEAAASLAAAAPSSRTEAADSAPPVSPVAFPAGSPEAVAQSWVLTGGEDHALVAAFPPGTALPARWQVIGEVRGGAGVDGAGVTVDGAPHEGPAGWQHFR